MNFIDVKGWGGWNYAIGSTRLLKETVDQSIKVYCIFDSDYYTEETIKRRYNDAQRLNVQLHIWVKKELENYLINPEVILRIFRSEKKKKISTKEEIQDIITVFADSLRNDTLMCLATEIQKANKGIELKTAIERAEKSVDPLMDRICGKEMISRLSEWAQKAYQISLSPLKLAQNFYRSEIPPELVQLISLIEKNKNFDSLLPSFTTPLSI